VIAAAVLLSSLLARGLPATALMLVMLAGCGTEVSFQGTEFSPPQTASPFQLRDQFSQPLALDDLDGRVVVLTFLYTGCPDTCPLMAETLRKAHESLGDEASETAFVAISVDPARDTTEEVRRFSEEKGMLDRWSFLTGTEEELKPVWQAYYVAAEPATTTGGALDALSSESEVRAVAEDIGAGGYLIGHSTPVYLIDRSGMLRVLHTSLSLDPQPLIHDIRLLLE
jgi:cytochrome oxidase Cu insertion factor (SCO1/SenC/PrrC family)